MLAVALFSVTFPFRRLDEQRQLGRALLAARIYGWWPAVLVVWFIVSLGFGVILVEPLKPHPLSSASSSASGFAQQGSILVFIALIFFYAWRMNRLDREHGMDEE